MRETFIAVAKICAYVLAAFVMAIVLALTCAAIGQTAKNYNDAKASVYAEEYVPGQSLDMVRMSAPAWSSAEEMYRIVDRTSGACWMRIQMDGKWETWLVCEGQSYVNQQIAAKEAE